MPTRHGSATNLFGAGSTSRHANPERMSGAHIVALAGHAVELLETGEGPPVVLLHSSGVGAMQWRRLMRRLAPEWRVIAPNLLGYGHTPWNRSEPFDHRLEVSLVKALLATLTTPAHLVGHSYGALLALRVAMDAGRSVASLAVYEPVLVHALESATGELSPARSIAGGHALAEDDDEHFLEQFVDYWTGRGAWRALPPRQRRLYLERVAKIRVEVRSSLADPTGVAALSRIDAPTLVMSGSQSPAAGRRMSEIAVAAITGAQRRVLVGAGHMGPLTHAREANEAIAQHLSRAEQRLASGAN